MLELYYKYPQVLRRLRSGGLGDEMDRIAAYLFEHGYKRGSAKVYLSRLGRFSDHVSHAARATPIEQVVIDGFVGEFATETPRIAARTAIELARRVAPERFSTRSTEPDPHGPLLDAYLDHLRHVRGLEPKTCEGRLLAARRILAWHDARVPGQPLAVRRASMSLPSSSTSWRCLPTLIRERRRPLTSARSCVSCIGPASMARILPSLFRVRPAIGWPTCRPTWPGKMSGARSMRSRW